MHFEFERRFLLPRERLFAFHENPDNLALLMQSWPTFRMVSHSGHIGPGAITEVRERMGPVWVSMTFEHFLYEPPDRFGERQVRGPFQQFVHVHEFLLAGGGTLLRDRIDLRLPWYLGGELAMRLLVAGRMRRFFAYRHAELERLIHEGVVERATA